MNGLPVSDVDDQMLVERYHIAPTKEGYTIALEHSASDVRAYGALRLAAIGAKEALPAILAALAREEVAGTRISMASAAFELGAAEGFEALKGMCQDRSSGLRMSAAGAMLNDGKEDCLDDVLEVLRVREDLQDTIQALYLVPRFKQVPAAKAAEARDLLQACIESDSIVLREQTAYPLTQVGGPWAIEMLRRALAVERDEVARGIFSKSLAEMGVK